MRGGGCGKAPTAQFLLRGHLHDRCGGPGAAVTPNRALCKANILIEGMVFSQPATFWRKSLMDRAGLLDESLKFSMDYDLFCRMAPHARYKYINAYLATYRLHEASKTCTISDVGAPKHDCSGENIATRFTRTGNSGCFGRCCSGGTAAVSLKPLAIWVICAQQARVRMKPPAQ